MRLTLGELTLFARGDVLRRRNAPPPRQKRGGGVVFSAEALSRQRLARQHET